MSENKEESAEEALLRKHRERLFGHTKIKVPAGEAEENFAGLQRENYHLRVLINALQLATAVFIRQKVQTAEETALFNGNVLMVVKRALFEIGATGDEISRYMFGEGPEGEAAYVYATKCMEFAEKALEVTDAMYEMHSSLDPIVVEQRAIDAANEKERKKKAN